MHDHDERLIELETKLAYQEDTIQALNDIVCKQQKQLDKLERSLTTMAEKLKELEAGSSIDDLSDEPPPPHY